MWKKKNKREQLPIDGYEWLTTRPIAHRGLHDEIIPENSIPAFEAAIAAGCSIEMDVQITKDGVPVIFHDDFAERMSGVKRRITRMTLAEVSKLRLAGTDNKVPTFKEFLELVDGRVPLLIELKRNRGAKGLEQIVVDALKGYKGKFAMQSFHPIAVSTIHDIAPEIYCGLLSSKFTDFKMVFFKKAAIKNARLFFMANPDFISFDINSFPNRRIAGFRKDLKMPVLGWTIKTKEDIDNACKFCDGIIFENIKNLKTHLHLIGELFAQEFYYDDPEDEAQGEMQMNITNTQAQHG